MGSGAVTRDPTQAILALVGVVVLVYLAGHLIYKLREILLLLVVAGFVALLLNPAVVMLQRRVVRRRGGAVAIVTAVRKTRDARESRMAAENGPHGETK